MHVKTRFFVLYIYPELEFFKNLQGAFLIYTKNYLFTKNQEYIHSCYKISTWAGACQKKNLRTK